MEDPIEGPSEANTGGEACDDVVSVFVVFGRASCLVTGEASDEGFAGGGGVKTDVCFELTLAAARFLFAIILARILEDFGLVTAAGGLGWSGNGTSVVDGEGEG